tara:strand:- start:141 stop:425 length:285 start_codon:yes stop_codon:yes gene_type:complete
MEYRTDQERLLDTINIGVNQSLGPKGSEFITALATPHAGPFYAITVIENTVFGAMTDCNIEGLDTATTFVAGLTIMGSFPQVTLTSGKVLAYKL